MAETNSTTEAENATHTPGPWLVHGLYVIADQPTRDVRGSHRQVADWACGLVAVGDASAEQLANARLIAAAPDLLASCYELRLALAAAMRVISPSEQHTDAFVAQLALAGVKDGFGVRAGVAIARAEGTQS